MKGTHLAQIAVIVRRSGGRLAEEAQGIAGIRIASEGHVGTLRSKGQAVQKGPTVGGDQEDLFA